MQSTYPSTAEPALHSPAPCEPAWQFVRAYAYTDEHGELLYENCRFERILHDGKREKKFQHRRPDPKGTGYIYNLQGVRRLPYRLPEFIEAGEQDVHCTEGEKDVDALAALGLCATSVATPSKVELEAFQGRNVVIHEDNDAEGRRKAKALASGLVGIAANVRIVNYTDLPEGGDVSDFIAQDHGLADVLERCEAAEEFHPPKVEQPKHREAQTTRPSKISDKRMQAWVAAWVPDEFAKLIQELRDTQDGQNRNAALNTATYQLYQLVARGWLDAHAVEAAIREACGPAPGGNNHWIERRSDAEATFRRAHADGLVNPYRGGPADKPLAAKSDGHAATATNGAAHDGGDFEGGTMSARKETPAVGGNKANDADGDPLPLYVHESRDDKFPLDALGPHLKSAVCALQAVNQTPIEMAANSILGVISLVCQAHGDIQFPIAAGPSPISLYLLTIAESGERKSANDNIALKAVRAYQNELRETYRIDFAEFKNKHAIWLKARDTIIADKGLALATKEEKIAALGLEPEPPISHLIVFSDPTIQAIVKQLCQHRPSLGVFSSEAAIFLSGYSMGGDGKLNAAGILCETWDGRGPSTLRAGDGETSNPGCRLAMHLAAQRNIAQKFLGDADLREQGTLSRFMVVDPESTMGTRFWKEPTPEDMRKLAKFDATILRILRRRLPIKEGTRNELVPTAFEIDDDARVLWVAFHDDVERALAPGGLYEPIRGIAAKLPENAGRLAACISMYEHEARGGNAPLPQVGIESLKQGIELARFYARTALRLVDAEEPEHELTTAEKVLRFLHEKGKEFGWLVCLPDIYQKGPAGIRKTATAREAMRVLEEHRHVKRMPAQVVRDHFRQEVWGIVKPKTPAKAAKVLKLR